MAWLRHNFIQSEVNATCKNQLSCCRQVWFVIGKTHNVAIQLVLQKCGKISYSGCCPFLFLPYLYTLSLFLTQNLHCLCVWTPSSVPLKIEGKAGRTVAWISSDCFESLLLPQLLRAENDSKQSDEIRLGRPGLHSKTLPEFRLLLRSLVMWIGLGDWT